MLRLSLVKCWVHGELRRKVVLVACPTHVIISFLQVCLNLADPTSHLHRYHS